jgi:hypothetical protein
VTVHYATRDGSATAADGDYLATSGDLVFSAGQVTKTVTVYVKGDKVAEALETFFVDLSNAVAASGVSLGFVQQTGTAEIKDGKPTPTVASTHDVVSTTTSIDSYFEYVTLTVVVPGTGTIDEGKPTSGVSTAKTAGVSDAALGQMAGSGELAAYLTLVPLKKTTDH